MKKLLALLALFLLTTSCAHYGRTWTKKYHQKLEPKHLETINGSYHITPHQDFFRDSIVLVTADKHHHNNITRHLRMFDVQIDSSKSYRVDLKILNEQLLETRLLENDSVIEAQVLQGRLRKNGTFHLSDKINKSWGIPYLIGGNSQIKTRIGTTKDGDLYVQSAYYSGGALLLIFGDMRGYNDVFSYQKIHSIAAE